MNTFVLILFTVLIVKISEAKKDPAVKENGRQKRLLFYDEDGNLVKTYKNPYLYRFPQNLDSQLATNSINPFLNLLRPAFFGAYVIPISDEVIHQYSSDPLYRRKLLTVPRKDLIMVPNTLCSGLRTQLPSKDCEKFWNCWDGWAFEQDCPEGLVFSSDGFCDYPHNVDCTKRFTKPLSPASQQLPAILPQPSEPIIKPLQPAQQPLQETNPSSQQNQQPGGSQVPLPSKLPYPVISQPIALPQPIQSDIQSPCSKDYQAFRNEQECSEFFVCVDSVPIKFKCPADLLYSENIGVCDYPNRVECKTSSEDSKTKPGAPCASPANLESPGTATSASDGAKSAQANQVSRSDSSRKIESNAEFFRQNGSPVLQTHVAISRHDAVRQLKFVSVANVSS